MIYLLDTNVVSQSSKPKPSANILAWLRSVDDHELCISAMTVRELRYGAERGRQPLTILPPRRSHRAWTRSSPPMRAASCPSTKPWPPSGAGCWPSATATRRIPPWPATALVHGLTLVTANIKDVTGRGVPLLNPSRSPPKATPV